MLLARSGCSGRLCSHRALPACPAMKRAAPSAPAAPAAAPDAEPCSSSGHSLSPLAKRARVVAFSAPSHGHRGASTAKSPQQQQQQHLQHQSKDSGGLWLVVGLGNPGAAAAAGVRCTAHHLAPAPTQALARIALARAGAQYERTRCGGAATLWQGQEPHRGHADTRSVAAPACPPCRHNVGFMVVDELAKAYGIECRKLEKSAAVGKGAIEGQQVRRRRGRRAARGAQPAAAHSRGPQGVPPAFSLRFPRRVAGDADNACLQPGPVFGVAPRFVLPRCVVGCAPRAAPAGAAGQARHLHEQLWRGRVRPGQVLQGGG